MFKENKSAKVNKFYDEIISTVSDEVVKSMNRKSVNLPNANLGFVLPVSHGITSQGPIIIYNIDKLKSNIEISDKNDKNE